MTTLLDYQDRTVDLCIYQGIQPSRQHQLETKLITPTNQGNVITGVEKLAQRFLLRLQTVRGSCKYLPNEGCSFMGYLLRGELRTAPDVFLAFAESRTQLIKQFMEEEVATDPDDEKLQDATLVAVTVAGGNITMTINLVTVAGNSRKAILPLPVVI